MTKKLFAIVAVLVLVAGAVSAQQGQSPEQKPGPEKIQVSGPANNHAAPPAKDSAVPSPEKYEFTEALKKLQGDNTSTPRPHTTVPPLSVVST